MTHLIFENVGFNPRVRIEKRERKRKIIQRSLHCRYSTNACPNATMKAGVWPSSNTLYTIQRWQGYRHPNAYVAYANNILFLIILYIY